MSDSTAREYLAAHPFFSDMSDEHLDFLASCATDMSAEADSSLFKQGDHANRFFIVREGHVVVEVPALYGPALEIQNLGADQLLGWSWLISPYQWDFQARAAEASRLWQFDGERVLAKCESDPAFGYELLKRFTVLMSERLTAARRKMMDQWVPSGFA